MRILSDIFYFLSVTVLFFCIIVLTEFKTRLEDEKKELQEALSYYQKENARLERLNQQTIYLLINGYEED